MDYNDYAARLATAPSQFGIPGLATTIGMRIRYIGSSASCTIEVAPTGILSKIGASGAEAADSNFESTGSSASGAITTSGTDTTVDTFGELVDFINDLDDYEAVLFGVKRDDPTTSVLATHAASATGTKTPEGAILYTLGTVTGGLLAVSFGIRPDSDCSRLTSDKAAPGGYKNMLKRVHIDRTVSTATGTCAFQIYSSNTLVWEKLLTATGAISMTLEIDDIIDGTIESGLDAPLLVRAQCPTAGGVTGLTVAVIGKSVKIKDS